MEYFKDKTVIVTGSSKGIGKATALAFLMAGANVVINARKKETLYATQKEFEDKGFHPLAVIADVSNPVESTLLVKLTMEKFERIDYLINNAATSMRGRFEDLCPEVFQQIINGSLLTAINATHSALPEIIKTKGSIIFISTLSALHGLPNDSIYCAAKAGVDTFAESLRIELAQHKVHIGLLRAGLVRTYPGKMVLGHDGSLIPVSRKGHQSMEDVARAVIRMVKKRRSLMTLTLMGKLLYFLEKVSPTMVYYCLRLSQKSKLYK
jgi:meso-butanediol dehydrogenase/(S,S)-butanediol dehydrogenase/diacetyl reductase